MKLFTEIVESKNTEVLQASELKEYQDRMKNKLPNEVSLVLSYLIMYNIGDKKILDLIMKASKSSLNQIASKLRVDADGLEDLQKLLKNLKENIKLLPMYMSETEREDMISGK